MVSSRAGEETVIWVKVCFFPVLLNVPDTLQPFLVGNETGTPLVHLLFFGVQLGKIFVISLQSFSKEKVMAHLNFTFPHLTWTSLTVSSTAKVGDGVTKRRRARPRNLIFSGLNALLLAGDPRATDRWKT